MNIDWQWQAFRDLAPLTLYQILQLRQQVFMIEQNCLYADIDNKDTNAMHLLGWATDIQPISLAAYARIFLPSQPSEALTFGRVVVNPDFRGLALGHKLVQQILDYLRTSPYRQQPLVISAQHYLLSFYQKYGFQSVGQPYDEDGVLHIRMQTTLL